MMRAIIGRAGYYWDPRWGPWREDEGAIVIYNAIPNQYPMEGPIYLPPVFRLNRAAQQRWNVSALEHARKWTAKVIYPQVRLIWHRPGNSCYVMLRGEPTPGR